MKSIYEFLADLASCDIKLWVEGDRLRCNAPKDVLTPEMRSQLAERKIEILSFLQHRKGEQSKGKGNSRIVTVSRAQNLPLSFAQQRLWFLSQLEGTTAVYNIPAALHLTGVLNITGLKQALQEIVRRHEVLRTNFTTVENSPVQIIHSKPDFDWLVVDLENCDLAFGEALRDRESTEVQTEIEREVQAPFDLAKDSLLRFKLLRLAEKEHILLLTMHHIISDGWSLGILVRELSVLYRAFNTVGAIRELPLQPLPIQYADFAVWQRQYLEREVRANGCSPLLDYWKQQLAGIPTQLKLPTDYPRPSIQTFRGGSCNFALSQKLTEKLKTLSKLSEASLFMILLAALGILLSRYSRQKDLVIGTPIANRNRQEIESLIGFFANTLALRLNLAKNPDFRDFLGQVRQVTLDAYAHQDLPFDRLVEELQPERSSSHSPLFQVMFALQNAPLGKLSLPGLTLKPIEIKSVTAKFDLTLSLQETESGLEGIWEYNSDLFAANTIMQMMDNYQTLLEGIVTNLDKPVDNLPLLSEAARQKILVEGNASEIKAKLLQHSSVRDCHILLRQSDPIPQLVAYVVTSGQLSSEQLQLHLRSLIPAYTLPSAYIPLSALPLTFQGWVNVKALKSLPVIDSNLVQQWEEQLHSLPEIDRVAVVVQQQTEIIPPIHLSDLLLRTEKITATEEKNKLESSLPEAHQQQSATKNLAVVHGESLKQEADAPLTLAETLQRAANQNSTTGIVYIRCDGSEFVQSYENLLEEAQKILAGLRKLGLKPQDKVIFQLERIQDFIPAFWGCILGGFVPVPISIPPTYEQVNSAVSKLQNAWQMLDKPLILAGANSAAKVSHLSELLQLDNFKVKAIGDLRTNQPDTNWHLSQPDDLAILLLTSGSTGMPKAVMQSHRSILTRSAATARMNNFTSSDVSLNWFPLDHVGGLVMFHLRDVYLGCQQIQVHTELVLQQPLKWLDLIEHYQATITWAPNFAYGAVVAHAPDLSEKEWDLSSMRFILNGGEAIVAKSARKFLEFLAPYNLSPTAMYPAWGMSETCSGVIYSHDFSLDSTTDEIQNLEVGMPIPGFSVRITDTQNQIVAESIIGRVQVKGLSVTSGYYQNPELNQEAFTDDGWFNTGDLGFLYRGRLTITGRAKDVIIINGINYYAHEIESVVEEIEGVEVSYTAAIALREAISDTDKLVIFFNSSVDDEIKLGQLIKTIRTEVVQNIGINPDYLLPLAKESIPKTSIGKIQRSRLSQQFLAGEFDALIKRLDLLLENNKTLPDWFYHQVWQPKEILYHHGMVEVDLGSGGRGDAENTFYSNPTLVFLDSLGLGISICQEFKKFNQPYIQVEAGTEFVQVNNTRYQINPNEPKHYQYLFESLASDDFNVAQILHLWTYDRAVPAYADRAVPAEADGEVEPVDIDSIEALEKAQVIGIYSLLYLVQALSQVQDSQKSIRLQVVSSYTQFVNSADKIAYQKAPILGFIKTIPQEMPWLHCRHIDLQSDLEEIRFAVRAVPAEADRPEVNTALVLNELRELSADSEVVYRNGQRLVSRLAKAELSTQEKQSIPFKKGGMYLITGGLGGVGLEIAKYLLKTYQARLLLVGRTSLAEQSDINREKLQSYQELEKLGGEINYQAVNICDRAALQQIINQAETNWGSQLEGIIHLAGVFQERLLSEETPESMAAVLRPKVIGTWVLHQLLDNDGIFINFSSVNGFFGGTGVGAYAAANSFIDNFAQYQKHQTSLRSYCFAWSMWDEMGMSRGYQYKDLTRERGFFILNPTQGINSFLAGLHHNQAQLLIGLDGGNLNLRGKIQSKSYGLQKLTAYFTANNISEVNGQQQITVRDRFGTKTNCDLIKLDAMPLTETGEIDRDLLGSNKIKIKSDRFQPQTEVERKIANIWQEVLNIPQVSIQDNFFELGGHSLLATQVISRIREAFTIELPLSRLFASPTVEGLSQQVETALQADLGLKVGSIQPVSRDQNLPLSFAQQRLWFLEQLEGANAAYNVPAALRIKGSLNITALEKAFQEIVRRHEVLRTHFPMVEGKPVQAIDSDFELSFTVVDLQQLSDREKSNSVQSLATESAQTPFDLEKDSLLRVKLLRLSESEHILLLTMHHIVADGWSLDILVKELSVLYAVGACLGQHSLARRGASPLGSYAVLKDTPSDNEGSDRFRETPLPSDRSPLPELPIQYADFAVWQRQYLQGEIKNTQFNYWKQQLQGIPPLLELPTDRPRPPVQTLRGNSIGFSLNQKLTEKLLAISQQSEATLFMTLLSAFGILLSRYSRQEDIVIGTAIANRNRKEIEPLIGFFTNTLALRLDLQDNPSFKELLKQVRQVTLEAYAHQDLPFEQLIEELQPERNLSHSPLFQVSFALQNTPLGELKLSGLSWSSIEVKNTTAKFDLSLAMRETESGIEGVWEYNCDLFETSTIERMMGHFQVLLEAIVTNPDESVTNLPLITQKEGQQLLEWNATEADYPQDRCIHQLFESQVAKTPDAVAVVFEKQHLTYRELNQKANQLAHYLQKLGVKPEVLVGLCVERSVEMLVGLLGILKAGGAYVPLDPNYPAERLSYMLVDSGVEVLLTQKSLLESLPKHQAQVVCLDRTDWGAIAIESGDNLNSRVKSEDLAYVIYTSGSTGQPKGVLVTHKGLPNLVIAQRNLFNVQSQSRVLQFASFSFDASVSEIFIALTSGATLVLATAESLMPGADLRQTLTQFEITHVTLPPSALSVLPSDKFPALSQIIVAGETCSTELVKQWSNGRCFFNAYGPTESTVCATVAKISDSNTKPTIGRPITNTQIYILDSNGQPAPIGVPGELHIGSVGLARGYLNRPELTKEKFIPNPFVEGRSFAEYPNPQSLIYKTGDLARYLPNGNIEFLGRLDNQVKIRGFRIELGEIESVLSTHPQIQQVKVIEREDTLGNKRLVAYLVPLEAKETDFQPQTGVELWPSVAEFYVYDELLYYAMTNDHRRNQSYQVAINQLVKDKIVVEIGTGKDAILAKFCAEAGAKKVYAIERDEQTSKLASARVQELGLSEQIKIIHGDATTVNLPEEADVCVSEIVGAIGGCEGAAVIINNARRFLKPDGVMIPERSVTQIIAVTLPDELLNKPQFTKGSGYYTQKIFEQVGYPFDLRVCIKGLDRANWLSDRGVFEDLDFTQPVSTEFTHSIRLTIAKSGRLDGFLVGLNLHTIEGECIDILEHEHSWLPVYFPVFEPGIDVNEGDVIEAVCTRTLCENNLNPDYALRGRLLKKNGEYIEFEYISYHWKQLFKQTPFYQRLFADNNLEDYAINGLQPQPEVSSNTELRSYLQSKLPDYMIPSNFVTLDALPLTPNGKIDRRALATLDISQREAEANFVPPHTTTEETLSKIWAEVLGIEQVGIENNFFELGGDSILSIQIVSKANQAGLQLTPKQMFQHQTIAELASVVGTTKSISGKQDLVTGSVPLTPIQHWFFEQDLPEPQHFNQAVLLEVEPDLKPDLLQSAIANLLQHHDALRLQFTFTGEDWTQINAAPDAEVPLQIEDLSNLSDEEQRANMVETFHGTSLRNLDSGLIQIILFNLGNNKPGRLFIVIHHLAVDGVSWRILLEDIATAYQQLNRGETIQLPPKTTSFQEWAIRLQAYRRSPKLASELDYWLTQSGNNTALPVDYPEGKEDNTVASSKDITVSLSEAETRALLQEVPSAYNTQINDVLLTALLQSFSQWTGENSLLVDLEGHGREEIEENIDLSRTVGWFTSIYPLRLQQEGKSPKGEVLKSVKEQLRRVPKLGIGYGILRYLGDRPTQASLETLPSAEVSFNYLGQFEQILNSPPILGVAQEPIGQQRSSLQKRQHLLEINSIISDRKLQITWTYSEKVHRKATVENLAGSFIEALQALIAHCQSQTAKGYTPSDFAAAKLNQKQLDKFMNKLKKNNKK
ncbi:conserved hypothetical protein [Hyella patelloides LEGE 07179]|uniref:Carrier domain-containing protein n=1 Tax=Hyella patelloides LEGE 07179 TaxID=945734 RepID=A0A563VWF4_9CYAN|nr:non-ribosomal peptide synthetase [Hyella patelloides]VEP15782.1 conserved hypothetical protein [Hyella patelloides LEGE 07179]